MLKLAAILLVSTTPTTLTTLQAISTQQVITMLHNTELIILEVYLFGLFMKHLFWR